MRHAVRLPARGPTGADPTKMGLTYEPLDSAVSERLDSLFGSKDCLIEVNPGHVIMPPRYQDIGDRIRGLQLRADDVWVVSYPRTGWQT